ncbi:MAG: hypothetical protein ACP5TZ_04960, partial [Nitrososphaeria archaeon]
MVWLLIAIIGLAFFSYILVSGMESLAGILNLRDYTFMLIVFPVFSSLPDLVIIVLNLLYGGTLGPGMALSAAVGEPFIVIVLGIPAVLILSLAKFGRNGLKLFNDPEENINLTLYVPIIVSVFAYLTMIFLARIYIVIVLTVIIIVAFYIYITDLKNGHSENVKKMSAMLTGSCIVIGFIGLAVFGKLLVESVIQASLITKISPFTQSFIVFPLSAAMPEIFASFSLILKGKREAAIASLLGEIVITATLYPALIFAFLSPALTFTVIMGMVMEIISATATIIISLKSSMIYVVPFDLAMIILFIIVMVM